MAAKTLKPRQREKEAWMAMRRRCRCKTHPWYHRYGGRGIDISPEWDSFEQFYADMGPRPTDHHSLERKDNDKGYSRDNCFWATRKEQSNNRSLKRPLTALGKTLTVGEWASLSGISYTCIHQRIQKGWDPDHAVTWPSSPTSYRKRKQALCLT